MNRSSYIRFVGGPWHNRVVCVELLPVRMVMEESDVLVCVMSGGSIPRPETKHHQYHLKWFQSWQEDADGFPLLNYQQYLHQSLLPDPPVWVAEEVGFPPLPEALTERFIRMLCGTSAARAMCGGGRRKRKRAD
jgi:hypothetical protein